MNGVTDVPKQKLDLNDIEHFEEEMIQKIAYLNTIG